LFRIGLGVDAKKLDTQIAKEKLSLQEQGIVDDVKKTFYNLVQAQSALTATEETITLLKEMNRIAANGLEQQVILKSDMLDAEAGLAKAESEETSLHNTVDTLKEKMNDLLARDLATEFTVSQTTEVKPWEMDLASTRALALQQRPETPRGAAEDSGSGDRSASEESRVHSRRQFEHELPFSVRH
jgi:outer membrane protein TolC